MKVVINRCYGGFGLSKEAYKELGLDWDDYGYEFDESERRSDPKLVAMVKKLGSKRASGQCANLIIVEIPDGVDYVIEEHDGQEWVAERHRTWS